MNIGRATGLYFGLLTSCLSAAAAQLGAEAWKADIDQLVGAIHEHHPTPFRDTKRSDFEAAVAALHRDLDGLDDQQVVARLAEVVALLRDGHTRLSIPRYFEGVGVRAGHHPDFDVQPSLRYAQLPVELASFADGVHIVRGVREGKSLVGARLLSYAGVPVEDAIKRLGQTVSAENDGMRRLMAVDRLALPGLALASGIGDSADSVMLQVEHADGERPDVKLPALSADAQTAWREAMQAEPETVSDGVASRYARRLDGADDKSGIVHLRIDVLPDEAAPAFIKFAASAVRDAEQRKVALVIDLRGCFGGNGSINRGIVLAVARSAQLNQWGQTFVLTGPRTFSACQQLTDELQHYARVMVVGEPTGSRPDHYGDSRRVKLERSGLTLRVSTLHHNSWIGNDSRTATLPHVRAPYSSAEHFSGSDPALRAIAALEQPVRIGDLVANALRDNDHHRVYLVLQNHYHAPDTATVSIAQEHLRIAQVFIDEDKPELARFALRYGLHYEPGNAPMEAALAALPKAD